MVTSVIDHFSGGWSDVSILGIISGVTVVWMQVYWVLSPEITAASTLRLISDHPSQVQTGQSLNWRWSLQASDYWCWSGDQSTLGMDRLNYVLCSHAYFTGKSNRCTVHSLPCTVYSIKCTLYSVHYILYSRVHCQVYHCHEFQRTNME